MPHFANSDERSALSFEASVYHAIFESSSDCVKLLTVDGAIQSMNARSRALLFIDDLAILEGTMWRSLWDAGSHVDIDQALDAARSGATGTFSGFRSSGDAEAQWWDAWVRPILDDHGRVRALIAVSRDMTSVREAMGWTPPPPEGT